MYCIFHVAQTFLKTFAVLDQNELTKNPGGCRSQNLLPDRPIFDHYTTAVQRRTFESGIKEYKYDVLFRKRMLNLNYDVACV
jgi:hypothetical protein